MNFQIVFKKSAQKELEKLPAQIGRRIQIAIDGLSHNPRPHGYTQLNEFDLPSADPKNLYRIRVGDYRIIYTIEEEIITVTVVKINHRNKIYKNR